MRLPPELRCPEHGLALTPVQASEAAGDPPAAVLERWLGCPRQCRFPIVRGIPRFVRSDGYAEGFGLQWLAFRRTQLDSYTRTSISRERLARCLGGELAVVAGRSVLEVGCGAGRFTEVLLAAGARVFAVDLSAAVEANHENCGGGDNYFVCQADALQIPAAASAFDFVIALGMLQHTPSPEATICSLARHVTPGGLLVIDHYARPRSPLRRLVGQGPVRAVLRSALLRLPPERALEAARRLTAALLPLHRTLWKPGRLARRVRRVLHLVSPVFDYYDRFPQLSADQLADFAFLDTHDGLTDRYKHLRSAGEIRACLESCGLEPVAVDYAGNGVEARARRPAPPATA